jgi:hypothetical protein
MVAGGGENLSTTALWENRSQHTKGFVVRKGKEKTRKEQEAIT